HLNDRFLPDKAIDVMDEVGAAVKLRTGPEGKRTVKVRDVEQLVARMAGIPTLRASGAERVRLEHLEEELRGVVFGQEEAVSSVARAVKRGRAGLGGGGGAAGAR